MIIRHRIQRIYHRFTGLQHGHPVSQKILEQIQSCKRPGRNLHPDGRILTAADIAVDILGEIDRSIDLPCLHRLFRFFFIHELNITDLLDRIHAGDGVGPQSGHKIPRRRDESHLRFREDLVFLHICGKYIDHAEQDRRRT